MFHFTKNLAALLQQASAILRSGGSVTVLTLSELHAKWFYLYVHQLVRQEGLDAIWGDAVEASVRGVVPYRENGPVFRPNLRITCESYDMSKFVEEDVVFILADICDPMKAISKGHEIRSVERKGSFANYDDVSVILDYSDIAKTAHSPMVQKESLNAHLRAFGSWSLTILGNGDFIAVVPTDLRPRPSQGMDTSNEPNVDSFCCSLVSKRVREGRTLVIVGRVNAAVVRQEDVRLDALTKAGVRCFSLVEGLSTVNVPEDDLASGSIRTSGFFHPWTVIDARDNETVATSDLVRSVRQEGASISAVVGRPTNWWIIEAFIASDNSPK